jgi:NAD(P)-dependent dehydrogenase (short-subunit alcohol dehydrogenase family)
LCDIHEVHTAYALLQEIEGLGRRGRYDRVDVSDVAAVNAWIVEAERSLGTPSLIIPCAAVVTMATTRTLTPEIWRRELSINLDGVYHLAQAGALLLLARKMPGRIVFIGSWAGETPHPHIVPYCVAKAGLRMLAKCMALELAPHGILVNEVAPGWVNGGLARFWYEKDPASRDADAKQVPIKRLIEPEEVALQVAHLCDPANRHMTGSVVLMDGGLSLVSPASAGVESSS